MLVCILFARCVSMVFEEEEWEEEFEEEWEEEEWEEEEEEW